MPEFDNDSDRLEQFFRKATNKPDVTFSEDDWKKLEVRLDASDAARAAAKVKAPKKTIITAALIGMLLLSSVGIWWGSEMNADSPSQDRANVSPTETAKSLQHQNAPETGNDDKPSAGQRNMAAIEEQATSPSADEPRHANPNADQSDFGEESARGTGRNSDISNARKHNVNVAEDNDLLIPNTSILSEDHEQSHSNAQMQSMPLTPLAHGKVQRELVVSSADFTERNKQKARIELPGAEEADQTGRQTMVEEEHASDKTEHVAKPRLSLLLSFAPDFSGTSLSRYSSPGKAFGAMIQYHLKNRWRFSAGVIKNHKQYTGAGEDYTPPTGYWKYYTNGVIPETIDGSCSILEFPIMVQYTVRDRGRNQWTVGAGASSYLMQSESYRYHFGQPNPGAKDGWDSRGSSRFMFNMLNLTIGYELQVIPGLMIGLEPYVKVPLEEIGWSNLRLYSTGASVTLRYTLVGRRQSIPGAVRSRGPD